MDEKSKAPHATLRTPETPAKETPKPAKDDKPADKPATEKKTAKGPVAGPGQGPPPPYVAPEVGAPDYISHGAND